MELLLFIAGFPLLLISANFFVDASALLARKHNVSEFVIGLTVVSIGTSLPEMVVNLVASIEGNSDIALGNIIGSNLANILLIIGLSATLKPIVLPPRMVYKEVPYSIFAMALLLFLANDTILYGLNMNTISRYDSMLMLMSLVPFLYVLFSSRKDSVIAESSEPGSYIRYPWLLIFIGLLGIIVGGKWIVDGSMYLANYLGLSESFIALTLVSVGTSIPELSTSLVAVLKNKPQIAVGNVIGSNIFNTLLILGLSGLVNPIGFESPYNLPVVITILASVAILYFVQNGSKKVTKWQGWVFLIVYLLYLLYYGIDSL